MLIDFSDSDNVVKTALKLGRTGDLQQATPQEIDEILYWFERPYYRYWAGGTTFVETKEWKARRAYIQNMWNKINEPLWRRQQARHGVRALAEALEASAHVICNHNAKVWAVSNGR